MVPQVLTYFSKVYLASSRLCILFPLVASVSQHVEECHARVVVMPDVPGTWYARMQVARRWANAAPFSPLGMHIVRRRIITRTIIGA